MSGSSVDSGGRQLLECFFVGYLEEGAEQAKSQDLAFFPRRPMPTASELSQNEIKEARAHFDKHDESGAGTLSRAKLASALVEATKIALVNVRRVMRSLLPDKPDEAVDLQKYLDCVAVLKAINDNKAEREAAGMSEKLLQFCFPDLNEKTKELADENTRTFVFAVTDGDGKRSYGFCRRLIGVSWDGTNYRTSSSATAAAGSNSGGGGGGVLAVCIVSALPWISFFFQAAHVLGSIATTTTLRDALTFATSVSNLHDVERGATVSVAVPEQNQHASLTRTIEDIDLLPLMSSVDSSHVLALFASLLFDRRILMLSTNLERASLAVIALGDLLRPFRWVHIFIPVLPNKWIDYILAPMPYICAMHASNRAAIDRYPTDDVVIADLDDRSVLFFEDDLELLPGARLSKLLTVIDKAMASYHKCGVFDNAAVKQSFLRFFAHVMVGYTDFVSLDPPSPDIPNYTEENSTSSIALEPFLSSRKGKVKAFMEVFALSQHFEEFIKMSGRPSARDTAFDSMMLEKAKRAKKLIRMPEFKTLRMHMQKDSTRATAGVAFDEKTLIERDSVVIPSAQPGGGSLYKCLLCDRAYNFKADLDIHNMKRHSTAAQGDGTFKCSMCDNVYTSPEDLAFHMKKRHDAYSSTSNAGGATQQIGAISTSTLTSAVGGSSSEQAARDDVLRLLGGRTNTLARKPTSLPINRGVTMRKLNLGAGEQFVPVNVGDDDDDDNEDGDTSKPTASVSLSTSESKPTASVSLSSSSEKPITSSSAATGNSSPSSSSSSLTTNTTTATTTTSSSSSSSASSASTLSPTLSANDRATNRKSVIVQRNPNRIVLTVCVPSYQMEKKLEFDKEHKVSHVISQITDTAFFQETRKLRQKSGDTVAADVNAGMTWALHTRQQSDTGSAASTTTSTKMVRMSNDAQLGSFNLSPGDRILLFPVRPALPSNDRVVSGFMHSSLSSSANATDDSDRGDQGGTTTWSSTTIRSGGGVTPRSALMGSSRSVRLDASNESATYRPPASEPMTSSSPTLTASKSAPSTPSSASTNATSSSSPAIDGNATLGRARPALPSKNASNAAAGSGSSTTALDALARGTASGTTTWTPNSSSGMAASDKIVSASGRFGSSQNDNLSPDAKALFTAAKQGVNALMAAAKKASPTLPFEARDKFQQSVLHIAAFAGDSASVQWLLSLKKRPSDFLDAHDKNGWTALHAAASAGHLGACEALLDAGALATVLDGKRTTPLHYAVRSASVAAVLVPRLLTLGAVLDARDDRGETPLFHACFKGCLVAVQLLVAKGASLASTSIDGETCLHFAARNGDVAIVELLLTHGAQKRIRANSSGTARDVAISCGHSEVVALLDKGEKPTEVVEENTSHSDDESQSEKSNSSSTTSSGGGGGGGHYQTFDPALRIAPTLKLRAIVGDESDAAHSVGVTLRNLDTIAQCMSTVFAGCDIMLEPGYDRTAYGLFKRRPDGSFVELPPTRKLLAAGFESGDIIHLRLLSSGTGAKTPSATSTTTATATKTDSTGKSPATDTAAKAEMDMPIPRRKAPTRIDLGPIAAAASTLPLASSSSSLATTTTTTTTTTSTSAPLTPTSTSTLAAAGSHDRNSNNLTSSTGASISTTSSPSSTTTATSSPSTTTAVNTTPTPQTTATSQYSQIPNMNVGAQPMYNAIPGALPTTATTTTPALPERPTAAQSPASDKGQLSGQFMTLGRVQTRIQTTTAQTATTSTGTIALPSLPTSKPVPSTPPKANSASLSTNETPKATTASTSSPTSTATTASSTASTSTSNSAGNRARITKKVALSGSLADVWRVIGDFFDLKWTGVDTTLTLSGEEVAALNLTGIGGAAAQLMIDTSRPASGESVDPCVGRVREFRVGTGRPIRHRCITMRQPSKDLLTIGVSSTPTSSSDTAVTSAAPRGPSWSADAWCGYAYELLVETALLPRLPVQVYASELRLRPSSSGTGVTVEWLATITVRDDRVVQAVSEEYEKSLGLLSAKFPIPDSK